MTLTDGGRTTHIDGWGRVERSAGRRDLQTRHDTLQCLGGIGHGALGQLITIYNGDGSGQVDFFLYAKAHDDHFTQCLGIFQ